MTSSFGILSRLLGLAGAVFLFHQALAAQDSKAAKPGPRVVAGKAVASGLFLRRDAAGGKWLPIKPGEDVYTNDTLVGFADMVSKNGGVRLSLQADLDGLSPFPTLESAVILGADPNYDLTLTFDRGRIDLANLKKDKHADIRLRFHHENWELSLEPKTRVALELYGRWPAGVFFDKAKPKEGPTATLVLICLEGELTVGHDNHRHVMRALPGPAIFHWDSVVEEDTVPKRLEKLPAWADPATKPSPEAQTKLAIMDLFRRRVASQGVEAALTEAIASGDPGYRRLGVIGHGATDSLPGLVDALADKHDDVRDAAVMVLRHWIGRGAGQDAKLSTVLTKEKGFPPNHAEAVLHLLHGFGDAQLNQPGTYEVLIDLLHHDRPAIRTLAHWHLVRLVPLGVIIPYDPTGPKDQLEAAFQKWKKLVPDGKLPPKQRIQDKLKELKEKLNPGN